MNRLYVFLLLTLSLCMPMVNSMGKEEDVDQEMSDQPDSKSNRSGSHATSSGSSGASAVSRQATFEEQGHGGLPPTPPPQSGSHQVLPAVYLNKETATVKVGGKETTLVWFHIEEYEKEFYKNTDSLAAQGGIPSALAEVLKSQVHTMAKISMECSNFVIDSLIAHSEYGLKTLSEYLVIKRPEQKREGSAVFKPSSTPERKLENTFQDYLENFGQGIRDQHNKLIKSNTRKTFLYTGFAVTQLLLTAGTFATVLYFK